MLLAADSNNDNFRSYTKEFKIPEGVQVDKISSSYSAGGILTVEAPRVSLQFLSHFLVS